MQEARASWNTIYLDTEGFECQVTLRDEDEIALTERATVLVSGILESGGVPVVRRGRSESSSSEASTKDSSDNGSRSVDGEEKTYVDDKGLRRCNLPLRNGRRCSQPVTEREGRYGLFWSCPRYKDHAPTTADRY